MLICIIKSDIVHKNLEIYDQLSGLRVEIRQE